MENINGKNTELKRKLGYDRIQAIFSPECPSVKNPNSPDGLWGYVMQDKRCKVKIWYDFYA